MRQKEPLELFEIVIMVIVIIFISLLTVTTFFYSTRVDDLTTAGSISIEGEPIPKTIDGFKLQHTVDGRELNTRSN